MIMIKEKRDKCSIGAEKKKVIHKLYYSRITTTIKNDVMLNTSLGFKELKILMVR